MKMNIELDMTPEEARAMMGLPDVGPLQKQMLDDMRARMESMVRTFPDTVRSTWQQTITREVEDTPAGALPVRKKP